MSCQLVFRASPRRAALAPWLALAVALLSLAANVACGGGSSAAPADSGPVAPPPTNITGTPVAFFGMNVNQQTDPAPNIPIASLRMWDDHTAWAETSTGTSAANPGYDFTSTMNFWLNQSSVYGTDFLFDLARTPGWAQCPNDNPPCGITPVGTTPITCFSADLQYVNTGGPGQCFPPSDLNTDGTGTDDIWITWVTAVAQNSVSNPNGHIKYYEIWNEPNVPEEWQGTVAQLIRMTQDARCVIIGSGCNSESTYPATPGIDPTAQILTPAFVNFQSATDVANWLTQFLGTSYPCCGSGSQYVDVIAFHGYLVPCKQPCQIPGPLLNPPEDFADAFLPDLASVISSQSGKPLFNTEGSWGHTDAITDPQEQVAWVARYVLIQASNNIAKFYWYSWDGGPLGLWSSTGGTSPTGYAYGVLETQWLQAGLTIHACAPQSSGSSVWTCSITRSGGYSALAVWDTSQICSPCGTSTFSVPSQFTQYLTLENSDGTPNSSGTPTPLNGATTVQIGAIPILLETGNP